MTTFFGYNSLHNEATLTASSANSFYPVSNTQNPQTIKEWRSATSTTTATIVIDLGSAQAADTLMLAGSAVDRTLAATTVTLEANTSDSWGTPAISETFTDIEEGLLIGTFDSATYRYWRITVTNTGGTYCGFSSMFLGTRFVQPVSFGWNLTHNPRDIVTEGLYGQIYGNQRNYQRSLFLPLSAINKTELDNLLAMFKAVGISQPVWVVVDSAEGALSTQQYAGGIFRLVGPPLSINNNYGLWDVSLSLAEII